MAVTYWRRRAPVFLAGSVLVFVTLVFLAIRERPAPTPVLPLERTDPTAVVESVGAIVIQTRGGAQQFRVEAKHQLSYADGTVRLEGVKLTIPEGNAREFVVTGERAEVHDKQTRVTVEGAVRLSGSDGTTAEAERASYDDTQRIVQLAGSARFVHGPIAASSVGATYESPRNVISLLDRAVVRVAPRDGGVPIEIVASTAAWARGEHYWRFEGGVTMTREMQVMAADTAVAYLTEDDQRIRQIDLQGGARITGGPAGGGSLDAMRAGEITLVYDREGGVLQRATLSGTASVELAGESPRQIAGDWIEATVADGRTLTQLIARGGAQVDFPPQGPSPARRIRAGSLAAAGEPGRGLTSSRFDRDVEFRELWAGTSASAAIERTVRAQTLVASVKPGMSDIEDAVFSGDVVFTEGAVHGEAGNVRYRPASGVIELLPAERSSRRPHVSDERVSVDARRIEVTPEPRRLLAEEDVRSIVRPAPPATKGGPQPASSGTRVPRLLKEDQPIHATAARLSYDRSSALVSYAGTVKLWQGETTIQGDTITLDERTGGLTVKGSVRSRTMLDRTNENTGARERIDTLARAEELHYDDDLRRATYTTDAQVIGPQGHLNADRIELFLREEAHALERLEGHAAVKLRMGRRIALGDRLTYFDTDGRYVMSGAPVRIVEELATECRETTGRILTFFRSTDTITVDGNPDHRTQTKTGGTCPELPLF